MRQPHALGIAVGSIFINERYAAAGCDVPLSCLLLVLHPDKSTALRRLHILRQLLILLL